MRFLTKNITTLRKIEVLKMSALKEFVIAIKTKLDQSEFKKTLTEAQRDIKLVAQKINTDMSAAIGDVAHNFKGLAASVGLVTGAVGGAVGSIALIAEHMDDFGDWADKVNASAAEVEELGYAAQLSGSSLDAVKSSYESLSQSTGEAALGVGRAKVIFDKLNLSATDSSGKVKDTGVMLDEVSAKLRGLGSRSEQLAFAGKLGIDPSLVPLLTDATGKYQQLIAEAKQLGAVNQEAFANAGAFQDGVDKINFAFKSLTQTVAAEFMPPLTDIMNEFVAFYKSHKEEIKQKIINFFKIMKEILVRLWPIVKFAGKALSWFFDILANNKWIISAVTTALTGLIAVKAFNFFTSLGKAALTAASSFKTLAIALWANPLMIIAGLVGILLLVLEDFNTWLDGGDSALGKYYEKWSWLVYVMSAVGAAVDVVKYLFNGLLQGFNLVSLAVTSVCGLIESLLDLLFGRFAEAGKKVQEIWSNIKGFFSSSGGTIDVNKNINENNKKRQSQLTPNQIAVNKRFDEIDKPAFVPSSVIPLNANNAGVANAPVVNNTTTNVSNISSSTAQQTAGDKTNNQTNNVTNNVTIKVDGAGDPNAAARAAKAAFEKVNRDTIQAATAPAVLR